MNRLLLIVLFACATTVQGWCSTPDTLRGGQFYDLGRAAFGRADYAAALSNLSTFKSLNKSSLQSHYSFAFARVEETISVCLEEIDEATHPRSDAGGMPVLQARPTKFSLALPPKELLAALGNTADGGNVVAQSVNDSSARYFYLALIAQQRKNEMAALAHLEKSVSLDSSNGAAALALALSRGLVVRSVVGQTVTFSEAAQSLCKRDSQIILSAYIGLANKNLYERKPAEAWRYYEKAARMDAGNLEAQTGIAEVCLKMNRMAPALQAMEAIAGIRPGDYNNQWRLACLYYNFGRYDRVIAMVPELRTRVADTRGWAMMLGKAYQARQNYGKSIEYLQQVIKEEPANSEAPYLIAHMLVQMENYKQGIIYYRKALAIDSLSQPGRMYELALALSTDRQFGESIACFKKALERGYKPSRDFYKNLTGTLADAQQPAAAIATMKELLLLRPADAAMAEALGDVYYNNGYYKDAINTWNELMQTDNRNARTMFRIGRTYIKMGKGKEGQELCRQAIVLDPSLSGQMRIEGD